MMDDTSEELHLGKVNSYDSFKGFGFIRREKGRDVYFHFTDVEGDDTDISIGDRVQFSLKIEPKGPRAIKVVRL